MKEFLSGYDLMDRLGLSPGEVVDKFIRKGLPAYFDMRRPKRVLDQDEMIKVYERDLSEEDKACGPKLYEPLWLGRVLGDVLIRAAKRSRDDGRSGFRHAPSGYLPPDRGPSGPAPTWRVDGERFRFRPGRRPPGLGPYCVVPLGYDTFKSECERFGLESEAERFPAFYKVLIGNLLFKPAEMQQWDAAQRPSPTKASVPMQAKEPPAAGGVAGPARKEETGAGDSIHAPAAGRKAKARKRLKVSVPKAAALCGVSGSSIEKWEKGTRPRPAGYPGRGDAVAFRMWAEEYKRREALRRAALAMNRAAPRDPGLLQATADKDALDED